MTPQDKLSYGKSLRFLKMAHQGLGLVKEDTFPFDNPLAEIIEAIEYHLARADKK